MRRIGFVTLAALLASVTLAAQAGVKPVSGGSPGSAQPQTSDVRDRISMTGCLRRAPEKSTIPPEAAVSTTAAEASDLTTVSDNRFVLSNANRIAESPPDTTGTSPVRNPPASTYRLEGLDSQLAPFLDTKVQLSGEVKPRPPGAPGASPTLVVLSVEQVSTRC